MVYSQIRKATLKHITRVNKLQLPNSSTIKPHAVLFINVKFKLTFVITF